MIPIPVYLTMYHPYRGSHLKALRRVGLSIASLAFWLDQQRAGRCKVVVQEVASQSNYYAALWDSVYEVTGLRVFRDIEVIDIEDAKDSQRLRHITAYADAVMRDAGLYVVADDDMLPREGTLPWAHPDTPEDWFTHARRVFDERPELVMASAYPQPSTLRDPLTAPGIEHDQDVWYTSSVGGVRVCRTEAMPREWPEMEERRGGGYDSTLCEAIYGGPGMHAGGAKVGYFRRWLTTHMGKTSSLVWSGGEALYRGS